ncbi:MAG: universal stress protein [Acidobacteria bacterium]|nr:MAG: universal stress protein [Acidobacteriota bacterium]
MTDPEPTPSHLRTVVAATDLSETAKIGIQWATEIARDHSSRLHLIHGISLSGLAMDYVSIQADLHEKLRQAAEEKLAELAEEARTRIDEVDWAVEIGEPSGVITRTADKLCADLIVVGTRGLRGLDHLLLGSTAERVVQRANCPVLTVHPQDADRERPVRRILVATDLSEESKRAATWSLSLLAETPEESEVFLLHSYHVPYEFGVEGAYGSAAAGLQLWKNVDIDVRARLDKFAEPLRRNGVEVNILAIEGYPPEVIVDQAETLKVDLIAMGTHGRTGLSHVLLGSTAERVVQRAACPVLTVRREPAC